jgi:[acyl-carrier-protein] S-malonyltransferase
LKKIAFLFPGQGSQSVGMGHEFYKEYDLVRETFDMVEDLVKIHISRLCFKGPMEDLTTTVNLQPALTAVNLAILRVIQKEGVQADITAGHSLGEYCALCAANILSRQDTFRSVMKRGELMHREAGKHQGAMAAIIGLSIDTVEMLVQAAQSSGLVSVANHNMAKQIVVTGEPKAVETVSILAASENGRAVPLKVSGAWHSQLIKGAEDDFRRFLENIPFNQPERPVIHNASADTAPNPKDIREIMITQLCHPVKWYDTMQRLMGEQVEVFVETGPGRVLSGLLKKTLPPDYPGSVYAVNNLKSLENFLKHVA